MKRCALFLVLWAGCAIPARAQDVPLEYTVKAAYLFNFTKFVEWPPAAAPGENGFTICIAETNPFGASLASIIEGERAADRPIHARVVRDPASCHVLFIPRGVQAATYLRRVRSTAVLTVG